MFNIRYIYDGSLDGLLCCVAESLQTANLPREVVSYEQAQPTFFEEKEIVTDAVRAAKVREHICRRISAQALRLIEETALCDGKEKEIRVLEFVRLGLHYGSRVTALLGNQTVDALQKAVQRLHRESHQYLGFIRFSDLGGVLCAEIEPKNQVLPLIAEHLCQRYPHEKLMIYDRTHRQAFVYQDGQSRFFAVHRWQANPADTREKQYRSLWKLFYDTVSIEERQNERCRMGHMPKRYWSQLTEMQMPTDRFAIQQNIAG